MLCQTTICRSCYVLYLPIRLSGCFKLCLGQLGHHADPKKETLGHTLKANNSALLRAPAIFRQSGECQLDNVSSLLRMEWSNHRRKWCVNIFHCQMIHLRFHEKVEEFHPWMRLVANSDTNFQLLPWSWWSRSWWFPQKNRSLGQIAGLKHQDIQSKYLWLFKMAMENGSFIDYDDDDAPIENK